MSKLFDRLERALFQIENRVFGEKVPAIWISSDGSVTFSGIVLFCDATRKESVDQMSFTESDPYIEYLAPAFPGLELFVDSQGSSDPTEHITINGNYYVVTEVQRLRDGNNYKAYLQLVNDGYGPKNQ